MRSFAASTGDDRKAPLAATGSRFLDAFDLAAPVVSPGAWHTFSQRPNRVTALPAP
jgi:hypothetical protein